RLTSAKRATSCPPTIGQGSGGRSGQWRPVRAVAAGTPGSFPGATGCCAGQRRCRKLDKD
ncbi:MAG: hypothetical protein ACREJ5_07960, partial [Geminicoccaceae bacterium]